MRGKVFELLKSCCRRLAVRWGAGRNQGTFNPLAGEHEQCVHLLWPNSMSLRPERGNLRRAGTPASQAHRSKAYRVLPAPANWLCLVCCTQPVRLRCGAGRAHDSPGRQIGFVLADARPTFPTPNPLSEQQLSFIDSPANWLCFAHPGSPLSPDRPKLALFCMIGPVVPWTLPPVPCKLGLFCTTSPLPFAGAGTAHHRPHGQIGFVSRDRSLAIS
jgi:hypothetical protein